MLLDMTQNAAIFQGHPLYVGKFWGRQDRNVKKFENFKVWVLAGFRNVLS